MLYLQNEICSYLSFKLLHKANFPFLPKQDMDEDGLYRACKAPAELFIML